LFAVHKKCADNGVNLTYWGFYGTFSTVRLYRAFGVRGTARNSLHIFSDVCLFDRIHCLFWITSNSPTIWRRAVTLILMTVLQPM